MNPALTAMSVLRMGHELRHGKSVGILVDFVHIDWRALACQLVVEAMDISLEGHYGRYMLLARLVRYPT